MGESLRTTVNGAVQLNTIEAVRASADLGDIEAARGFIAARGTRTEVSERYLLKPTHFTRVDGLYGGTVRDAATRFHLQEDQYRSLGAWFLRDNVHLSSTTPII